MTEKGAVLSDDGVYRYELTRRWGPGPLVCWVMLNPSTADAEVDDPTIRRCMGFTRRWGHDGIKVVNLYALRATDPKELARHPDPIGPANFIWVRAAVSESPLVVVAWGASAPVRGPGVSDVVVPAQRDNIPVRCLGRTKQGFPRHPLYVKADTPLEIWPKS